MGTNQSDAISVHRDTSGGKRKFTPPGYDSKLQALMAVIRFGPEILPDTAFKVLLFHAERSIAYNKASDAVSLTWMTNGIRKKGGGWLRCGSGLSKSGNEAGNRYLEANGLLVRNKRRRANQGLDSTEYTVQWEALARFFTEALKEKTVPTPAFQKSKGGCFPRKQGLLSTKAGNRVDSSSQYKNSSSQSDRDSSESSSRRKPVKASTEPNTEKPFSLNRDDDERTPEVPDPTTEQEARERVLQLIGRNKANIPERTVRIISRKFDKAGWDSRWMRYYAAVVKAATSPEKLHDQFYTGEANDLINAAKVRAQEKLLAMRTPTLESAVEKPRCPKCKNSGYLGSITEFCDCEMGQEVQRVTNRKRAKEAENDVSLLPKMSSVDQIAAA